MIDVLTAELRAPLTEDTAELYVGGTVFKTGPPRLVGVELEWLVHDTDRSDDPVHPGRLTEALADLDPPLAGLLTTEPGGQLELSSPPAPLAGCLAGTTADLDRLRRRLAAAGLTLTGRGLDPRPPVLLEPSPRHAAMAAHFAARGPEGRTMMCSTASVQVCVDAGADEADLADRWRALHAWLPVLTGLFAHSPRDGWKSARTAVWAAIDPSRTAVPPGAEDGDPRAGYARWALDAQVLAVRRPDGPWTAPPGLTFRGWLRGDRPGLPRPTRADLDLHLSTLFPPVRARGHLELRALDAQPGDGWRVPAALVAALLDDPAARAAATAAARTATATLTRTEPSGRGAPPPASAGRGGTPAGPPGRRGQPGADPAGSGVPPDADPAPGGVTPGADPAGSGPLQRAVLAAARTGMAEPGLRKAGLAFTTAAADALRRAGLPAVGAEVAAFAERFPARGRCPADDLIEPGEGA